MENDQNNKLNHDLSIKYAKDKKRPAMLPYKVQGGICKKPKKHPRIVWTLLKLCYLLLQIGHLVKPQQIGLFSKRFNPKLMQITLYL
jgi:hypothetical protein